MSDENFKWTCPTCYGRKVLEDGKKCLQCNSKGWVDRSNYLREHWKPLAIQLERKSINESKVN